MIVRILENGQYELDDELSDHLLELDAKLESAVEKRDEAAFADVLNKLITEVKARGRLVNPEEIVPSDLALPSPEATVDEVRDLLSAEPS